MTSMTSTLAEELARKESIRKEFKKHEPAIRCLPQEIFVDFRLFNYELYFPILLPDLVSVSDLIDIAEENEVAQECLLKIQALWYSIKSIPPDTRFNSFEDWREVAEVYEGTPENEPSLQRREDLFNGKGVMVASELIKHMDIPEVWAMLVVKANRLSKSK